APFGGKPPELDQPGLALIERQAKLGQSLSECVHQSPCVTFVLGSNDRVSGREESHLPALSEPCLSLSTHTAPIVQPSGRTPSRQCANSFGSRRATRTNHRLACRV